MPRLMVSFEIGYDDDQSYGRRRNALDAAVKDKLPAQRWWDETTSCYIIITPQGAMAFVRRVAMQAGLRPNRDKLLAVNVSGDYAGTGAAWGGFHDERLFRLMPGVKKLA